MAGRTSGANTTPLGRPNPAMFSVQKPTSMGSLLKPSYMSAQPNLKRDRDDEYEYQLAAVSTNWPPESSWSPSAESQAERERERKRKRKSRWGGDEKEKVFIPGLPTVLPNNLNPQQERAYLLQLQIEEISRRLRTGDLGIPPNPEDRSPSPEPIYNSEGKRLNTREYRTRKRLEDDRHSHIQEMYTVNPEYKPPPDYKPPLIKVSEKVMIPQEEHPDINFVGLLIGPRGNTLKAMEKETGAKIIIRGKGSVKEGKVGRKDGQPLPGEDEPLHAFVTGNSNESVKKAVAKIREIIRQGVEVPEGQNDLRRMQLRELALLNGTLRENDGPRCTNCGATTHRSWQCPDKPNITNNVICTNCGAAGHISKDCKEPMKMGGMGAPDKAKIDEEYMSLMAELGEGPPPPAKMAGMGGVPSTVSPLAAPPGPPRAIMAPVSTQPPQTFQVATTSQAQWNGSGQSKSAVQTAVCTAASSSTVVQTSVFAVPPPTFSQLTSPMTQTSMQPPWQPHTMAAPMSVQQQTAVFTSPVASLVTSPPVASMLTPPPPPPNLSMGTQPQPVMPPTAQPATTWLTQPSIAQTTIPSVPWQIPPQPVVGPGPVPVPPVPPGVAALPPPPALASVYPWASFMGVPPPPSIQASLQTLAAPPPPPPASGSGSAPTGAELPTLGLPSLLSAPPPPPPT